MKQLIMCEGANELGIINILLDNEYLKYTRDDLLGLVAYHARQINTSAQVKAQLNIYPGNDISALRIGDKLGEKLIIPRIYKDRIINEKKYCTKPELEMLLIISEGLVAEYEKVKSHRKAKDFAKENVFFNRIRYNNSTKFYKDYFSDDVSKLVDSIYEYKRIKGSHKNDELYLADLLK